MKKSTLTAKCFGSPVLPKGEAHSRTLVGAMTSDNQESKRSVVRLSERISGRASPMRGSRSANLKPEKEGLQSDHLGWLGAAMMRCCDFWAGWRTKSCAMKFKPSSASFGKSSMFCSGNFVRREACPTLANLA